MRKHLGFIVSATDYLITYWQCLGLLLLQKMRQETTVHAQPVGSQMPLPDELRIISTAPHQTSLGIS